MGESKMTSQPSSHVSNVMSKRPTQILRNKSTNCRERQRYYADLNQINTVSKISVKRKIYMPKGRNNQSTYSYIDTEITRQNPVERITHYNKSNWCQQNIVQTTEQQLKAENQTIQSKTESATVIAPPLKISEISQTSNSNQTRFPLTSEPQTPSTIDKNEIKNKNMTQIDLMDKTIMSVFYDSAEITTNNNSDNNVIFSKNINQTKPQSPETSQKFQPQEGIKIKLYTIRPLRVSSKRVNYKVDLPEKYRELFDQHAESDSNQIIVSPNGEVAFGVIPAQVLTLDKHMHIKMKIPWKHAIVPTGTYLGTLELLTNRRHWKNRTDLPFNKWLKMKNVTFDINEEASDQDIKNQIEQFYTDHTWLQELKFSDTCSDRLKLHTIKLCYKYASAFCISPTDIGKAKDTKYEIHLTDETPIKVKPYPMSEKHRLALQQTVNEYMELGIVEYSDSAWNAPTLLVEKSDGSLRLCLDFRRLNAVTIPSSWPLHGAQHYLDLAVQGSIWSSFDISQAFANLEIPEEMRKFTSFSVGDGNYQFRRCAFGLRNSGNIFNRALFFLFQDCPNSKIINFVDDLLVSTNSIEENLHYTEIILKKLSEAGFKLKPKKTKFYFEEITFLGFKIGKTGLRPDPDKIAPLFRAKKPQSVRDIKSLLGSILYWSKFVPELQTIATPLTNLTQKDVKWKWGLQEDRAYMELLRRLSITPILARYESDKKAFIICDASLIGGGSLLGQYDKENKPHIISYYSTKWDQSKKNMTIYELELLIVILTLKHYRKYLLCLPEITCFTDNSAVSFILHTAKPDMKILRYINIINQFNISFVHIATNQNSTCDWLSRAFESQNTPLPITNEKTINYPHTQVPQDIIQTWKTNVIKKLKLDAIPQMPEWNSIGASVTQTPKLTLPKVLPTIQTPDIITNTSAKLTSKDIGNTKRSKAFIRSNKNNDKLCQPLFNRVLDVFPIDLMTDVQFDLKPEIVHNINHIGSKALSESLNEINIKINSNTDQILQVKQGDTPQTLAINSNHTMMQTKCQSSDHLKYKMFNSLYIEISKALIGSDKYAFQLRILVIEALRKHADVLCTEQNKTVMNVINDITQVTASYRSEVYALATILCIPIQVNSPQDMTMYYPRTIVRYPEIAPFGSLIQLSEKPCLGFIWTNHSLTREDILPKQSINVSHTTPTLPMQLVKQLIQINTLNQTISDSNPKYELKPEMTSALNNASNSQLQTVSESTYPNHKQINKSKSEQSDPLLLLTYNSHEAFKYYPTQKSKTFKPEKIEHTYDMRKRPKRQELPPSKPAKRPRQYVISVSQPEHIEITLQIMLEKQKEDILCQLLTAILFDRELPYPLNPVLKRQLVKFKPVLDLDQNGVLINTEPDRNRLYLRQTPTKSRPVLPLQLIAPVLVTIHMRGPHFGLSKTLNQLCALYWRPAALHTPGLHTIARHYLRTCLVCPKKKQTSAHPNPMLPTVLPPAPKLAIAVDYMSGLPDSYEMKTVGSGAQRQRVPTGRKYKHLFVAIDLLSSYVFIFPTEYENSETSVQCIEQICSLQGVPLSIKSDNASYFLSPAFTESLSKLGIETKTVLPYSAWSNSLVEHSNLIIQDLFKTTPIEGDRWHELIPYIQLHMNTSYSHQLQDTPGFAHTGTDFRLPHQLLQLKPYLQNEYLLYADTPHSAGVRLQNNIISVNKIMASRVAAHRSHVAKAINSKRRFRRVQKDDIVFIRLPYLKDDSLRQKLISAWTGPYRVAKVFNYKVTVIQCGGTGYYSCHANNCKVIPQNFQEEYVHWVDAIESSIQKSHPKPSDIDEIPETKIPLNQIHEEEDEDEIKSMMSYYIPTHSQNPLNMTSSSPIKLHNFHEFNLRPTSKSIKEEQFPFNHALESMCQINHANSVYNRHITTLQKSFSARLR